MIQRTILGTALVLMIVITVLAVFFVPSTLAGGRALSMSEMHAPTPTPTLPPTPTPTPLPPTATPTPPPFISGAAAYVIDADTNRVLYQMNGFQQLPIASTTKIMTAIVAIENGNLDQGVTVGQSELDEVPSGSSSAGLVAGDYFRLHTLLYALMLRSGTDASIVIAHTIAGSTANFVAMMNQKAQQLQLTHTHFNSPHGFDGNSHYSSAADLVKLANYAMRNAVFAQIVGQRVYDISPTLYTHKYHWENTNSLLFTYQGADGVKTGFTNNAGVCLVFSARRNGHHLIGAELHASSYEDAFDDGTRLLDLGFSKV